MWSFQDPQWWIVLLCFSRTEKVTRHCDGLGNWVQTGSSCQPALKDKLEVFGNSYSGFGFLLCSGCVKHCHSWPVCCFSFSAQKEDPRFLRDAPEEAAWTNADQGSAVEKMILENEKKCLERMKRGPTSNNSGPDAAYYTTPACFLVHWLVGVFSGCSRSVLQS